ncbi:MAG: glycosyltransferase family 1 protein [Pseudomonadota bacterium]
MPRQLYYDLTEIHYLARGFTGYYGIAKVVAEGAKEAFRRQNGCRFVALSKAHGAFFEVFPRFDPAHEGGVDLNMPDRSGPYFFRSYTKHRPFSTKVLTRTLGPVVHAMQRASWRRRKVNAPFIELDGGAFLTCGRPKLIVHALQALRTKNVEVHALLHDMIPLHAYKKRPGFITSFTHDNRDVIGAADQIIANSQFTAKDIMHWAGKDMIPKPKSMSVAPLIHELRAGDETQQIEIPEEPYLFMVGTMLGRKNLDIVLHAMAEIARSGKAVPRLLLAGRARKRTEAFLDTPEMAQIKDRVIQLGSVNQTDLCRLYESATAVVLPSFIEGWGLPAAEALWAGTIPVCTDNEIMREVCGDAGVYFDPYDPKALADILARLFSVDGRYRAECLKRVEAFRPKLRTWGDFGGDLLDAVDQYSGPDAT